MMRDTKETERLPVSLYDLENGIGINSDCLYTNDFLVKNEPSFGLPDSDPKGEIKTKGECED